MAPEHLQGKPCKASDQYSLATILYEWLSGRRPFENNEPIHVHCTDFPPNIRKYNPAIPTYVADVIMKALHPDPNLRYSSIQEFITAYEQMVELEVGTALSNPQPFTLPGYPPAHNNMPTAYMSSHQQGNSGTRITMRMFISILTCIILIVGAFVTYIAVSNSTNKPTSSSSALTIKTTQAPKQQGATPFPSQIPSTDFTQGLTEPSIQEPMTGPSPHNYTYSRFSSSAGTCTQQQDGYHVIANAGKGLGGITCAISELDLNDIAVQAQVHLSAGTTFGLSGRWKTVGTAANNTKTYNYYRFMVSTDGTEHLYKGMGINGHIELPYTPNHSNVVLGLFSSNPNIAVEIAMKIIGHHITGYINGKPICQADDNGNSYTDGTIAFSSGPGSEAVFQNAQIYVLDK